VSAFPSLLAWILAGVIVGIACRVIRAVFDAYDRAADQRATYIEGAPDRSTHRSGSIEDFGYPISVIDLE
jgi:hypothetical protein